MIADRSHLAQQFKRLQLRLDELSGWVDNPDRQFPGDAVVLADDLGNLRKLLLADYDSPVVAQGAQTQLADSLVALLIKDPRWEGVPSSDGLTVMRRWPDGSVDTLAIQEVLTAHGRRVDAHQQLMWIQRGTVGQVVAAAADLPDPLEWEPAGIAATISRS